MYCVFLCLIMYFMNFRILVFNILIIFVKAAK
jgi:hypothetical protein